MALIAEVTVNAATGTVDVDRVVCAQDMGLGYVFSEEVRFEGGNILDANFDTYGLPRFSWMPTIDTAIVPNDDLPPKGGGEPAIINMGAVVANAVFDATGVRVYRLPMTPERVLAAMERG